MQPAISAAIIQAASNIVIAIAGLMIDKTVLSTFSSDVSVQKELIKNQLDIITSEIRLSRDNVNSLNISMGPLDDMISSIQNSIGKLRGQVDDLEANVLAHPEPPNRDNAPRNNEPLENRNVRDQPNNRQRLVDLWIPIRDQIEDAASDQKIDGRTRARYLRIRRNNYRYLVEVLIDEKKLPKNENYLEAARIWNRYRNGRAAIKAQDIDEMQRIVQQLDLGEPQKA